MINAFLQSQGIYGAQKLRQHNHIVSFVLQETADKCIGAGDIIQVAADLTVETDVERLVQKTIEHYKQLDVLVSK